MAYVNYYLDKPFDPAIEKERVKTILDDCEKKNKPYPKSLFNPRPTALYIFFTYEKGERVKIKTNIKIKPEHWNFKESCYRSQISGSLELNNELNELSTNLLKNYSRLKEGKSNIREEEVKEFVQSIVNGNLIISRNTFEKATAQFFEKKRNILSEGTFKEYRTVFKSLKEYEKEFGIVLKFEDFQQGFFNDYEQFMVTRANPYDKKRGLYNDTIVKYISTLKSFLYWCHESGFISNVDHLNLIKTKIKRKGKNEIISLTETELFKIYNHDFSENTRLERARDLFCFACFTGQRFSDIVRFNKDDYNDGIWKFRSFKTKKEVIIPFEGFIKNALPILEKYDYVLPVLSNQKLNDYLKEIGEKAEINAKEKIVRYSGIKEHVTKNPKYKFMSSHMGRRTFVTLMLEKGVPITIVQKLTQHADLRTLLKYENHSQKTLITALKTT
jgi:integrase